MKSIAVFCGSSPGNDSRYLEEAFSLGQIMAQQGLRLVYGGARVGLMGEVARGALEAGGEVVGVIPEFLKKKEVVHTGLTRLITTKNMHERKLILNEESDGFIALPGGFGTLEELFEIITWAQLGLHNKPVGILNSGGYYDHLIALLDHMVSKELLQRKFRELLLEHENINELVKQLQTRKPGDFRQRIAKDQL
ncbi:LOG family protein [Robertkochia flava]|uniref:LOG family protein n=1 Tax=Robertkochia flava TaxID=3447986 RepID=UPI001CC94896|nr:TIGR00730 family Rossman fold protein [Robertkochia marina]